MVENNKGNLEFAEKLLEIAEKDLGASKILYHNEECPQAVYLLQQSAEKAIKAYFVIMGFEPEDLWKFSHTPVNTNIIKSIHLLFLGHTLRNQLTLHYKFHVLDISQLLKTAEDKYEIEEEVMNLDKLDILQMKKEKILFHLQFPFDAFDEDKDYTSEEVLNDGDKYLRDWRSIKKISEEEGIEENIDKQFLKIYGKKSKDYFDDCYIRIYNKVNQKIKEPQQEQYMKFIGNFCENIIENIKWSIKIRNPKPAILTNISLLTGPHESCTRYPASGILEPSDYKRGLGIVDEYLKIHERLDVCVKFIKNYKNWHLDSKLNTFKNE